MTRPTTPCAFLLASVLLAVVSFSPSLVDAQCSLGYVECNGNCYPYNEVECRTYFGHEYPCRSGWSLCGVHQWCYDSANAWCLSHDDQAFLCPKVGTTDRPAAVVLGYNKVGDLACMYPDLNLKIPDFTAHSPDDLCDNYFDGGNTCGTLSPDLNHGLVVNCATREFCPTTVNLLDRGYPPGMLTTQMCEITANACPGGQECSNSRCYGPVVEDIPQEALDLASGVLAPYNTQYLPSDSSSYPVMLSDGMYTVARTPWSTICGVSSLDERNPFLFTFAIKIGMEQIALYAVSGFVLHQFLKQAGVYSYDNWDTISAAVSDDPMAVSITIRAPCASQRKRITGDDGVETGKALQPRLFGSNDLWFGLRYANDETAGVMFDMAFFLGDKPLAAVVMPLGTNFTLPTNVTVMLSAAPVSSSSAGRLLPPSFVKKLPLLWWN